MKKYLWIPFALAVVAAVVLMARDDKNYDTGSHGYDIKCVQSSEPSPTAASLSCTIDPKQNADQSQASPQWWHKLLAWPDGVTAWLLLLTLGAITWQSWETRKAAQSANRGIEVTKTKERAKLLLSPRALNPVVGVIPSATLLVKNVGESSAHIRMAIAGLHICDSESLPRHGSGYYEMKIGYSLLESRESCEEIVWWPEHHFERYTEAVADGKAFVHLHGMIRFNDAFDDSWGINFHFIWRHYGAPVWFPHLQANKQGEWEEHSREGEFRVPVYFKRPWWKFWVKATMPPPKRRREKPN
jgi:hypothetical protein